MKGALMNSFYIRKSTKSPNALESQNKELTELAGQLIEEDTSEQFLKMLANAKEGDQDQYNRVYHLIEEYIKSIY